MTTLTRDTTNLVVFWTLCERQHFEDKRYKKTQMATRFPADADPKEAVEEIYKIHGRVTDLSPGGRPKTKVHAKVASWSIVHPHERAEIDAWTAKEEPLFDAATLQACVSYKRAPF